MIASSIAIHNIIRGINGYSSLQISAKCFPVTTPNLAANNYTKNTKLNPIIILDTLIHH